MICSKCGYEINDNAEYCPYCGNKNSSYGSQSYGSQNYGSQSYNSQSYGGQAYQSAGYSRRPQPAVVTLEDLPPEFKPMGAWAYVGWGILFAIPIVGWVLIIVFSIVSGNINRKRFARSYLCWFLIAVVIIAILMIVGVITWNNLINGRYFPKFY